jgi:FAD/FMN-containing dehydrogenase
MFQRDHCAVIDKDNDSEEHGGGFHNLRHFEKEDGHDAVDFMWRIKRALNPQKILNPGNVVSI